MGAWVKTVNYRTSRANGDDSRVPIPKYLPDEKERRIGKEEGGEGESARDRRGSITRAETQNRVRAIGELKLRHAIYMATETIEAEWRWWRWEEGKQEESGGWEGEKRKKKEANTRKNYRVRDRSRFWFLTESKTIELSDAMHERLIGRYKYRRARRKKQHKSKFIFISTPLVTDMQYISDYNLQNEVSFLMFYN